MNDFLLWWQHLPSLMNPVIVTIGNFPVRWYGMMYIIAFAVVYVISLYRLKSEKLPFERSYVGDALTWAMVGVVLGGRIGYIIFYGMESLMSDPLGMLLPWASSSGTCRFTGITGMSYHGGIIGTIIALWAFSRSRKKGFFETFDLFIASVPLGYTFGRLGNFINGELYGRVTTAAIGMYFPSAPTHELRHPSQLYEAFFEGIVLFSILWLLRKKSPFAGFLSAMYLFWYGLFRFFIEYFREPDPQLGFVFLNFSMGQVLCFLMIVASGIIFFNMKRSATKQ
ncbi:MAG: prolipoprotein diacylglyceryl transferase [Chlorobiaceae bacterium]|nr:prolipoprotein diacylglyceryl transferase [Chlorobiaceae bacterium]